MVLGYSASEGSYSTTEVTFMAYVYLAETIAVIIITKMFSNKLKAVQKKTKQQKQPRRRGQNNEKSNIIC